MRQWTMVGVGVVAVLMALSLVTGCTSRGSREGVATTDDNRRFVKHSQREIDLLEIDIERYAISNQLIAKKLPLDTARFMEWRRREWWNLQREFAYLIVYEWDQVEKLTRDVGRFY